MWRLKAFDAYPKIAEDARVKTTSGACVSMVSMLVILVLFISELSDYLKTVKVHTLHVDLEPNRDLQINFNITLLHIPCNVLSLDAIDVSGAVQLDVTSHISKQSIDRSGKAISEAVKHEMIQKTENISTSERDAYLKKKSDPNYCGSCYGAEAHTGQCCNSCEDVRHAYQSKGWAMSNLDKMEQCHFTGETQDVMVSELEREDGCNMWGYFQVKKVQGNFHFAPGKSFQRGSSHVHDIAPFSHHTFNVSHMIHHLSFGESFPGVMQPLDNTSRLEKGDMVVKKKTKTHEQEHVIESIEDLIARLTGEDDRPNMGMFSYYVKVVPTTYKFLGGKTLQTNQYSVTEHYKVINSHTPGLPGIFFFYDLSPIMVDVEEQRQSFFHFLTQTCAILGGVFTVAGMIDKVLYAGLQKLEQKIELGKYS